MFIIVDPLAEKKPWLTGYNYCSNNPLNRIDPDGRFDVEMYTNDQLKDMGLTRADYDKFTNIVNNISNVVDDKVMSAIVNTTGLDAETVRSHLAPNSGTKVSLDPDEKGAHGNQTDGIVFSPAVVKYLGSLLNGDESIAYQTAGIALTLLHEFGHVGDQITNNGNNSGPFLPDGTNYVDVFGGNNISRGSQTWNNGMSGTGHRGFDVEHYGFGLKTEPWIETQGRNAGKVYVPTGETSGIPMLKIAKKLGVK